jgi:hypothetical protein
MASVRQKLTREWIQYLKNNQIAELQSNPKTGRLSYRREPTVTDLVTFLGKDFDEDEILDAIQLVKGDGTNDEEDTGGELAVQGKRDLSTRGDGNRDLSTWHDKEITPINRAPGISNNPSWDSKDKRFNTDDAEDANYSQRGMRVRSTAPSTWMDKEISPMSPHGQIGGQDQIGHQARWQTKPKRYNTDNAQDVQVKNKDPKKLSTDQKVLPPGPRRGLPSPQGSTPKRKPRFKYRYKKGQLKEAILDWQGETLGEKEIQVIFKILADPTFKKKSKTSVDSGSETGSNTVRSEADMQDQIRKLKQLIRDTMTDKQREALYRALTDV